MHTSHTYFKWQTNWYKCTAKRKVSEKNTCMIKWREQRRKVQSDRKSEEARMRLGKMLREREQKSWNEKYSVMLSWVGSMCLHVQSHLPSAVCWCDCRHRLALHNSFKDVSMKMHQCNGTQKNSAEPKETARKKKIHANETMQSYSFHHKRAACTMHIRVQFYYPMLCTIVKRAQSRFVISS